MLEHAFIIGFMAFSIYYTLLEGEIFGWLGTWFSEHTPVWMHQPLFDCPICMVPWYGFWVYFLLWGLSWFLIPTLMTAMGINYILNRFSDHDATAEALRRRID